MVSVASERRPGSAALRSHRQDIFTGSFALAAAGAFVLAANPAVRLAALTTATVFAMSIVGRTALEKRVTSWGVARGFQLEIRFFLLPSIALTLGLVSGLIEPGRALEVVGQKYVIVLLILAFGLLAHGLTASGYFRWAALRASRRGRGDTQRLLLNLFLVVATLTLVTSNDIMVFAFTPLVILMMRSSGIVNARLSLLILFIAANTSSMALYLGSPTNIILSQAVDLSPFTYTFVMAIPTIVSLMATLAVVEAINRAAFGTSESRLLRLRPVQAFISPLRVPEVYSTVQPIEPIVQNAEMRLWVRAFVAAVAAVFGLGFVTGDLLLPVASVAVIAAVAFGMSRGTTVGAALKGLPYQLIPFALTFFIVADAFGSTSTFLEVAPAQLAASLQLSDPSSALRLVAASGLSVNIFNDLPASALWGEVLRLVESQGLFDLTGGRLQRIFALQTILVGINIGTYLTPFGALAGIIWLNQMAGDATVRASSDRGRMQVPHIGHLVAYGSVMFVAVGLVTALSLIAPLALFDVLLSSPGEAGTAGLSIGDIGLGRWLALMLPSVGALAALTWHTAAVLRRTRLIDDVRQWLLPVSSGLRRLIVRAELAYRLVVIAVLVLAVGGLIQWVEATHSLWHDAEEFATGGGFFGWFLVFVGSGETIGDIFPESWLGAVLAGLLPISAIGGLVVVTRLPSGKWEHRVRDQLARAVIPAKRIVVVGFRAHHAALIRQLRDDDTTFVVLFVESSEMEAAQDFVARSDDSRIHIVETRHGVTSMLEEYNLIPSLRHDPPLAIIFGAHRTGSNIESLRALSELCRINGPSPAGGRTVSTAVLFECSSDDEFVKTSRLRERLLQSGHALVPLHPHRDYASLLVADLDADLGALSRHLGLAVAEDGVPAAFGNDSELVRTSLTVDELDALAQPVTVRLGADLLGVLASVGGFDAVFTPEDFQNLEIPPDERRSTLRAAVRLRTGSAAATHATAEAEAPGGDAADRPLLVVVNDTPRSRDFISRARASDPDRRVRLVTGQQPNRVLHANLEVAQASTPTEAAERVLIDGDALIPIGSRIFVFLREGEDERSESWTLDFLQALEQLGTRVEQSFGKGAVPTHDQLYVVIESRVHGEHGYEFVHNQLFVDSVFDPSMGERSIFSTIAQLIAQFGLPELPQHAARTLQSFAGAAGSLANVEARRVDDVELFPDEADLRLSGRAGREVAQHVAQASFPPRRLLTVLRPERDGDKVALRPIAATPDGLADAVVKTGDLLILLPSL